MKFYHPIMHIRLTKHVTSVHIRFSVEDAEGHLHLCFGGDTQRSDKSIMWSCFTVWREGEHNVAWERGKPCVCVFCVCSPAVQMFPIFSSPLALFRNP